jgi:hypothetical protein
MRIYGICLLKNEADIVRYSFGENLRWCDRIFVYDNNSADRTMDVVRELAREEPRIIPFGATNRPFVDSLRADVFNAHKHEAEPSDWWCRLDADEIHVDDVRGILGNLPKHEQFVWSIYVQFYPTEEDVPRLEAFEGKPPFEVNAGNLPRYYLADWAEPKFFRHRPGLVWQHGSWPEHAGLVASRMLRHKHFKYRSPAQIELRLATRKQARRDGHLGFSYSSETSWREKVNPAASLHRDHGDGQYIIEKEKLPRHLEPGWQRAVKRLLHGCGIWP